MQSSDKQDERIVRFPFIQILQINYNVQSRKSKQIKSNMGRNTRTVMDFLRGLNYKYHERWQSEIRDRTFFDCDGLEFTT